jgi:dihydroorotase
MLKKVAPLSSKYFAGALVMPNTTPPITSKESLLSYKDEILQVTKDDNFTPYMTLFFKDSYDYKFLEELRGDIFAIKLYPAGITTNSDGGVDRVTIDALKPTLEAMSSLNIPLAVHGESDGFVMDREREFIPTYRAIAEAFPDLKIIMEHITTKEAVKALDEYPNLFATITLHHLYITLDDVAGGLLRPHLFCKPIAKRPEDRDALLEVALTAHSKVMFGSDSAPHPRDAKEAPGCAAGVFTAPIALPLLAELFERHNLLDNLQRFVSDNAKRIYKLTPNEKVVTLVKEEFEIPSNYSGIVPFKSGEKSIWRVK